MCVAATARASSDFGHKTTAIDDSCATRDLEFRSQIVPAAQVHAVMMPALVFSYAQVVTTEEYFAT
jgi:Zn-dependent membrane protease YugP